MHSPEAGAARACFDNGAGTPRLRRGKSEVDMRLLLVSACAAMIVTVPAISGPWTGVAAAAECTGENCPPPSGQGSGHDCHRKRQEQTTS